MEMINHKNALGTYNGDVECAFICHLTLVDFGAMTCHLGFWLWWHFTLRLITLLMSK